ncbi:DUF3291 domain-containing protein [Methylophilus methylotrophus]|uniref:DUF3291 domain-containing protein n=1 Tax=Methylophilus methylotrophus TaxID=17 RepID=UPI000F59FF6D|nr:DUF3291 domain-containing protein [Methylophilus methylotrophus]
MTDLLEQYYLVQANIGEWDMSKFSLEKFQEFANLGGHIMQHADPGNGFIWAAGTGFYGDENVTRVFNNPAIILNLSIWRDLDGLKSFVYSSNHLLALKSAKKWFKQLDERVYVLWWIKAGDIPTIELAKSKLDLINSIGPSPLAFDFTEPFDISGRHY